MARTRTYRLHILHLISKCQINICLGQDISSLIIYYRNFHTTGQPRVKSIELKFPHVHHKLRICKQNIGTTFFCKQFSLSKQKVFLQIFLYKIFKFSWFSKSFIAFISKHHGSKSNSINLEIVLPEKKKKTLKKCKMNCKNRL